ncbi:MAG: hypothetical protein H7Z19_02550 [Chitinophagaceae bacterium]|nr:hypothetical protein [Rubrivivax sp.]
MRRPAGLLSGALIALTAGCMTPPQPGQSRAEVVREWGTPSASYTLPPPAGSTRLEYATGPFGRTTWMVDLDAAGRVQRAMQVLTDGNLMGLQQRLPGMPREQLLREIGTPGDRRSGGRQGGEIWSWRYATNECLWFRVSIGDDGLSRDGGFYPDPVCDQPTGV